MENLWKSFNNYVWIEGFLSILWSSIKCTVHWQLSCPKTGARSLYTQPSSASSHEFECGIRILLGPTCTCFERFIEKCRTSWIGVWSGVIVLLFVTHLISKSRLISCSKRWNCGEGEECWQENKLTQNLWPSTTD